MENKDYKYTMADYSNIYLGAKFSYRDVIEHPDIHFKIKTIIERYFLKDLEPDTTLESHFYYMTPEEFAAKTYLQLKTKVKFNVLEEKRGIFGKKRRVYVTKILSLQKFMEISLARKKADGIVIQEIILPKITLMGFVV